MCITTADVDYTLAVLDQVFSNIKPEWLIIIKKNRLFKINITTI